MSVSGGTGTDTLIVGDVNDISSAADAARYTGFETLRIGAFTQNVALLSGITGVEVIAGANVATGLNATQAANVKAIVDTGNSTFSLASAGGTADTLSLTMGTGAANTTEATDAGTLVVTGFETVNVKANPGTSAAAADRTTVIAGFTGATLSKINLTGTAVNLTSIATTVAVSVDGSALTGDGATTSIGLTVAGSAVAGSSVLGSKVRDVMTIGAEGSSYNGGDGNDTFTTAVANLVADGTTDATVIGGSGNDTLILSDASTLTDISFTNVSGMEAITLLGGAVNESVTGLAGSAKTAFANGITVTTASSVADNQTFTWSSGIYDKAVTLTMTTLGLGDAADNDVSITTGSGADVITVTAGAWVGHATTGRMIGLSTGAGDDQITFSTGTLLDTGGVSVTGGTGKDIITATTVVADAAASVGVVYNIASGDSTTTAYDEITGFDIGTAAKTSDTLNLVGTPTVTGNTTGTDGVNGGSLKSHAIASGIVTFDDAETFATAVVINSSNLSDAISYLQSNILTDGDTVAFAFDNDGDGTNDSTFVYQNTTSDILVKLVSVVGTSITATDAATAGLIDLA